MKTLIIDIPPGEVQVYLDARHKRQKDRFIELNYEVTSAFRRWMCCPKYKRRNKLSRHWQNCYMTFYSLSQERNALRKKLHERTMEKLAKLV